MLIAATPTPSPTPTEGEGTSITSDSILGTLLGTPLVIIAVVVGLLIARVLWFRVVAATVNRVDRLAQSHERAWESRINTTLGGVLPSERRRQRAEAVGALMRSAGTVVLVIVGAIIIFARLGVDIGPLLAGAGIVSIAVGFGAQSLVTDYISGVFMVLEDQYGVGDVVDTGSIVGTVEDVGLRITRVRDLNGVVWYIRNGEIVNLGNRSQGWAFVAVDMPVKYNQDLKAVRAVVDSVGADMLADPDWAARLLDPPSVAGVEAVSGYAVTVRVTTRAAAQQQLPVSRELRERLMAGFDAAGIDVPAPPPSYQP